MYTEALGQNAVKRYAMYLVSLALSADINERRLALTRAREHGLDMKRIAIVTAERIIDNAFRVSCADFYFYLNVLKEGCIGFTIVERTSSFHYCSTGTA